MTRAPSYSVLEASNLLKKSLGHFFCGYRIVTDFSKNCTAFLMFLCHWPYPKADAILLEGLASKDSNSSTRITCNWGLLCGAEVKLLLATTEFHVNASCSTEILHF